MPRRKEWFIAVFIAILANGVASQLHAWMRDGWGNSAGTAVANWIVWASALAIIRLLWRGKDLPLSRSDGVAIGALLLMLLWPLPDTGWVTLSAGGLYLALARPRDGNIQAAGLVMLALSVPMLWGRLLPHYLGNPLARFDTILVAAFTGVNATGNVLYFSGSRDNVMVGWGCTSFANASFALLLFVTAVRSVRPIPRLTECLTFAATFLSVLIINTARMALIVQSRENYYIWHGQVGNAVVGVLLPMAALGWVLFELRRDLDLVH